MNRVRTNVLAAKDFINYTLDEIGSDMGTSQRLALEKAVTVLEELDEELRVR